MLCNHKHVSGHEVLKGKVNPKIKHIFFLLPAMLFTHVDCFGMSYQVSEILRFLPSFQYNGTRWHFFYPQSTKNYI